MVITMKILFVDGYNVINCWPNLNKIKEYSFSGAREKLEDILINYASFNNCKVYLVYDAHMVAGNVEKIHSDKYINVVFTKDGETADQFIEKMVNNLGRKSEVMVVTSDWLEQQTIFQRGAMRMSSLEFYHDVLKSEEKIRKKTKSNYAKDRNLLEDSISEDVLKKLENMRRS